MIGSEFSVCLFVNSTLLLTMPLAIDRALATASAAVRHRLLVAGFMSLLLLPLFIFVTPTWRLPVLPANWNDRQADIQHHSLDGDSQLPLDSHHEMANKIDRTQVDNSFAELNTQAAAVERAFQRPTPRSLEESIDNASHEKGVPTSVTALAGGNPLFDAEYNALPRFLLALWFLGALIATAPLIIGVWRVNTICRNCRQIADGPTLQTVTQVRDQLKISGNVRVLESPESLVPMVWGLVRPGVIVPAAHRAWSVETCRLVMMHELAHVKRRDIFCQLMARFTCSLYWFHPLAWYALRRLRVERELACDDCVLALCDQPSEYARQLLDIAKSHRAVSFLPAVTMAQRSGLERRIAALLDRNRSHLPLNPRHGRALLIGAIGLAALSSVLRLEPFANASGTPEAQAQQASTTDQDNSKGNRIKITGRVVSPKNEPIPGAKVALRSTTNLMNREVRPNTRSETIAQTTTDRNGLYAFEVPSYVGLIDSSDKIEKSSAHFAVWAAGYGPAGRDFYQGSLNPDIILPQSTRPLVGRIVDAQGQPISGVKVRVLGISDIYPPVSKWIAEARNNPAEESHGSGTHYFYIPTVYSVDIASLPSLAESDSQLYRLLDTQTDNDGRFRLDNIGDDRLVQLLIQSPLVRSVRLHAITRKMEPANAPKYDMRLPTGKYFGNDFVYVAEPAQTIRGTVRDKSSGNPIEGVQVHLCQYATSLDEVEGFITSTTDREGHYELQGIPKANVAHHRLSIYAPPKEPYFRSHHDVPHRDGLVPIDFDIKVTRGIWIEGTVTDAATEKSVPSSVHYMPYASNPGTKVHETFLRGWMPLMYRTDEQGRFRVPGMNGKGMLRVVADVERDYQYDFPPAKLQEHMREMREKVVNLQQPGSALVELNIAEDDTNVTTNVQLKRRKGIEVHVVDNDGKDVVDYNVAGQFSHVFRGDVMSFRYWQETAEPRSTFTVFDDDLQTPRNPIIVFQKALGLGAVAEFETLKNAVNCVHKITLQPCGKIAGRILRGNANPATHGSLQASISEPRPRNSIEYETTLEDNAGISYSGSFSFLVPPGSKYWVRYHAFQPKGSETKTLDKVIMSGIEVGPGERIDLGDIDVTADPQSWPKPIWSKQAQRQVVRGRIVDPNGNPLRRVQVSGNVRRKGWEKLDDGQFLIDDYQADEPRDLYFYDSLTELAGYLRLEGNVPDSPTVKLDKSTTLQGRIVDTQGKPIPGVWIIGEGVPYDVRYGYIADEHGRFSVRGLVPGRQYKLIGQLRIRDEFTISPLATVQIEDTTPQVQGDIVWAR